MLQKCRSALFECACAQMQRRRQDFGMKNFSHPLLTLNSGFSTSTGSIPRHHVDVGHLNDVKLITFDITGTLLAFRKPPLEVYHEFGKKHGVICDKEALKTSFKHQWKRMSVEQPHFGTCWKAWWTQFVVETFKGANAQGTADSETLKKMALELIDHFTTLECWMLKDGTRELLTGLTNYSTGANKAKISVGIISNFDPRLYHLLELLKISNVFHPIILSHEHQVSKPSRDIFQLALDSLRKTDPNSKGINPEEALHVGDNYELDFVGAINAGWRSCLISPDFNILEIPENKRKFVPGERNVFPDLKSFHQFLTNEDRI